MAKWTMSELHPLSELYPELACRAAGEEWMKAAVDLGRQHARQAEVTPSTLRLAQEVLACARVHRDPQLQAAALNNLATLWFQGNDMARALELLLEARTLLEGQPASAEQRRTFNVLGGIHQSTGHLTEALLEYQRALDISRRLQDPLGEARLLNNLAFVLQQQLKFAEALQMFDSAEQLWRTMQQPAALARVLVNKASLLLDMQRNVQGLVVPLQQGMQCLQEAHLLLLQEPNAALRLSWLDHAARYSIRLGDLERAARHLAEGQQLAASQGSPEDLAFLEVTRGDLQLALGQHAGALQHFQQAYGQFSALGFREHLLEVQERIYRLHKAQGEVQQALVALEQLYQLDRDIRSAAASKQLEVLLMQRRAEQIQHEAELERIRSQELEQLVQERGSEIALLLEKKRHLEEANQHMRELSEKDGLTQVYNRRFLNEQGEKAFEQAHQLEQPLAALILDIDNFKRINDTLSHQAGDEVLRTLARILLQTVRTSDVVARYGGEEFVVLMPHTQLQHAHTVAERIRLRVQDHPWQDLYAGLQVTVSVGLASNVQVNSHEQMIHAADAALYVSKHTGKNRVTVSPLSVPQG